MAKKSILITGASRGIGAESARLFARAGWSVAVGYHHSEQQARALCAELSREGCTVLPVPADVACADEVRRMVDIVLENFCQLDTLLCNAGIGYNALLQDTSEADWKRLFATNVDGLYHCVQAVLPHFLSRHAGSILAVSSVWGLVGASCEVGYSATKAAVIGFCKALAKELGPANITVNCVAPGVIATDMNDALSAQELSALCEQTPLGRVGTPRDVAETLLFLASDAGRFYTGQVLSPNGGFVI